MLVGPLMTKWVAAAGVTWMLDSVPIMPIEAVSFTVIDCRPAVFSVAVKV
jgi:hypothetical protein